jgi:hypothetical protein
MAWVKPTDATPATDMAIIGFGDTNANEQIFFRCQTSGKLHYSIHDADGSPIGRCTLETDSAVFSDNTWTHVALVQDGTSPVLYVNGVAVAQTFSVISGGDKTTWWPQLAGMDNATIGDVEYIGGDLPWDGEIKDVRIHNRALDSDEVAAAYNGESTPWIYADAGAEKVVNGTAWTGATGSTPPTGWTKGSTPTLTIDSSSGSGAEPALKIARSADHPYIWQSFTAEIGKKYRVKYRVKNGNATYIRVGIGSSAIAEQYNLTDYS